MTAKGVLFLVVALLALLFGLLNWEALVAQQPLDLLVARVSAPLGLILLLTVVVLSALYLFLSLLSRYRTLKQYRDYEARLQSLQTELEQARFHALESMESRLLERFTLLEKRATGLANDVEGSLRGGQAQLEERLLQVRNELSADMAELERAVRGGRTR